jgi:hypothetical protein
MIIQRSRLENRKYSNGNFFNISGTKNYSTMEQLLMEEINENHENKKTGASTHT